MKIEKFGITIDTREQVNTPLPDVIDWQWGADRIRVEIVKQEAPLDFGDFAPTEQEARRVVAIERKFSIEEVHRNFFTKDAARAGRAYQRLVAGCRNPYLLLDFPPTVAFKSKYVENARRVVDALLMLQAKTNLKLVWSAGGRTVSGRESIGELIARILWTHVWIARQDASR